jgi:hypothetical protein
MTDTRHEIHFKTGVCNFLKNRAIAELLYRFSCGSFRDLNESRAFYLGADIL